MPTLTLTAVTPVSPRVLDADRQMRQARTLLGSAGFAGDVIRRMAKYPPQQPPLPRRPSARSLTGALGAARAPAPSRQYVRTGTLGRNWKMTRLGFVGGDIVCDVTNATDYATFVQGDPDAPEGQRQTPVMADKGWQNIVDEGNAAWETWSPRIVRVFSGP